MATLAPTPQDLIEEMTQKKGEDFNTYMKRSQAAFDRLIEESDALPDGEVVGAVISFPFADGMAHYRVVKAKPLRLQHLPFSDAWQINSITLRGLRLDDVIHKVKTSRKFRCIKPMFPK